MNCNAPATLARRSPSWMTVSRLRATTYPVEETPLCYPCPTRRSDTMRCPSGPTDDRHGDDRSLRHRDARDRDVVADTNQGTAHKSPVPGTTKAVLRA